MGIAVSITLLIFFVTLSPQYTYSPKNISTIFELSSDTLNLYKIMVPFSKWNACQENYFIFSVYDYLCVYIGEVSSLTLIVSPWTWKLFCPEIYSSMWWVLFVFIANCGIDQLEQVNTAPVQMSPSCLSQSLSSQSQNSPEIYHSSAEQMHFPQWQEPEITKDIIGCNQITLKVSI